MKRMHHMKTMFLTAIFSAILTVSLGVPMARAQGGDAERLVGTWQAQSTPRNCQTGAAIRSFPALNIFVPGGSMLGTSAGASGALASNAYGVWQHTGGQNFTNTFLAFRFNADGTYAGTEKHTRMIVLGPDFNEFSATVSVEFRDASGKVTATGCATLTGRRLE